MQGNLEEIMKDATNALNTFQNQYATSMALIGQHLPKLKENPEYSKAVEELEKQQKKVSELKEELKKWQ
jgi:antitoxin component of RelBE/YafQ-DinJ toxin-antitoxin module